LAATGNIYLGKQEYDASKKILKDKILPKLFNGNERLEICVLSAMAPGADMLIAHTIIEFAKERKLKCNLVVPLPVPGNHMLADVDYKRLAYDLETASDAYKRVEQEFNILVSGAVWIVPLYNSSEEASVLSDKAFRVAQYKKLGAYLAERADCLIAIDSPKNEPGEGGTQEVLAYRRDPDDIPRSISSLPVNPGIRRPVSTSLVNINPLAGTATWEGITENNHSGQ